MQLKASNSARFFLQDEYRQIVLDSDWIILSSSKTEERIPFTVWSGQMTLERGLLWGAITLYAHTIDGKREAWQVQGLPWNKCKHFVRHAIDQYQLWHQTQCRHLLQKMPIWKSELALLIKQPAYLADSSLLAWKTTVLDDLNQIDMPLNDAKKQLPDVLTTLCRWLDDTETMVDDRNDEWLEQERQNWKVLFNQIESSPLNVSQQQAVLLNNDHNLVLAGAGTGKTSVLTTRVAYLLQSHLAQASEILMLAFGREAASEMQARVTTKIGMAAEPVSINTFHQLGLKILTSVEQSAVQLTPLATDIELKKTWCSAWLKEHWLVSSNYKRWQKHLTKWPVAYLKGDEELIGQSENPKLIQWLMTQLDLVCMTHKSKKSLQELLIEHADYSRLNSELSLIWPCYLSWQKELKDNDYVDFNSMITKATKYVLSGKFQSPWKYIMVDEYQDISPDRLMLVESLCTDKKSHKQASLYAVGDDWQSIYQFAGSDVDLTTGFANRFASSTIHYLDTGYRCNSKISDVADRFIQKNPNQLTKEINSFKTQKQKAVTIISNKDIERAISELNRKSDGGTSVLILGRNHHHQPTQLQDWIANHSSLNIEFKTCHASKGKEADYVFIVGVDEGQFPSLERQPHLGTVVTMNQDNYPNAEERRLFYVALTRAKYKVWVVHGASPSGFVQELINDSYAVVNKS